MFKKYVSIGKNCKVHKSAIIGYAPVRGIKKRDLVIGSNLLAMSGAVIYLGSNIGDNAVIAHNAIIREENGIGNNFCLWTNSIIDYGCKIGNDVKIHSNVYIAQFTEIEDGVFIAPGVTIANDMHPKCKFSAKCMRGPIIKEKAIIGVGCVINPFVVIGKRALIGSGSVVTKDIPDGKVAYGNPAKVTGDISDIKCRKGLTDFPYRIK